MSYKVYSLENAPRVELHDTLGLTGAEISVNTLEAGTNVPFVHAHQQNEEVYFVVSGSGYVELDGDKVELKQGDFIKIDPEVKRQFFASSNEALTFVCIQTKANSLEQYTQTDAVIYK